MGFIKKWLTVTKHRANKALDDSIPIEERFDLAIEGIEKKEKAIIKNIENAIYHKNEFANSVNALPDGAEKDAKLETVKKIEASIEKAKDSVVNLEDRADELKARKAEVIAQINAAEAEKDAVAAVSKFGSIDDDFSVEDTIKKANEMIARINAEVETMDFFNDLKK